METRRCGLWRRRTVYAKASRTDDDSVHCCAPASDTVYHPVGTCKMGVAIPGGVDPKLRVYGLERLRIVDASVMPTLIGGNTNAPTINDREKAAAMIKGGDAGELTACINRHPQHVA